MKFIILVYFIWLWIADILILILGLAYGSALFKHEIAFVLGQLQSPLSVPYLKASLMDETQNDMVRHECAEALGAIATEDCLNILRQYLTDQRVVVRESCEVALDMCDYENSPDFQYANTLEKVDVWICIFFFFLNTHMCFMIFHL